MLGIDLGTTTTVVAAHRDGSASVLPGPEGDEVTPSVVAFLPGERRYVGTRARARRLLDPANTIHSCKRIIGLPWFAKPVAELRQTQAFDLVRGDDDLPRYRTRAGELTAEEVFTILLRDVATFDGVDARRRTVVTAPSSFEPGQRDAILSAARSAGFEDVILIDEAYAAALSFLDAKAPPRTLFVYDLGGGTFDAAVLRVEGLAYEVVAADGDPFLGGDDLDLVLAEWAADRILRDNRWDVRTSQTAFHNLVTVCQQAKVRLSAFPDAQIALGLVDLVLGDRELAIDRTVLDQGVKGLLQRSFGICDDLLRRAGLVARQVDQVILAGGSTLLPEVRHGVRQYFGKEPITSRQPDRLVALGACRHAASGKGPI